MLGALSLGAAGGEGVVVGAVLGLWLGLAVGVWALTNEGEVTRGDATKSAVRR